MSSALSSQSNSAGFSPAASTALKTSFLFDFSSFFTAPESPRADASIRQHLASELGSWAEVRSVWWFVLERRVDPHLMGVARRRPRWRMGEAVKSVPVGFEAGSESTGRSM